MRAKRFVIALVFLAVGFCNVYSQSIKPRSSVGISIGINDMFDRQRDKHTTATIDYRIFEYDVIGLAVDYSNVIFQNANERELYKKIDVNPFTYSHLITLTPILDLATLTNGSYNANRVINADFLFGFGWGYSYVGGFKTDDYSVDPSSVSSFCGVLGLDFGVPLTHNLELMVKAKWNYLIAMEGQDVSKLDYSDRKSTMTSVGFRYRF